MEDSLQKLSEYYNRRAEEIEKIYVRDVPQQQKEQDKIARRITDIFSGKNVLEVACGTGYWTQIAAKSADKITAIDVSEEMLKIALQKNISREKVRFLQADVYDLTSIQSEYDAGLAMFWLSHVPIARLKDFLDVFHSKLENNSIIFMADNNYIEGIGGELIHSEAEPDTYKIRTMEDGSIFKVLKNYYTANDLARLFDPHAEDMKIHFGKYFWSVEYRLKRLMSW